MVLIGLAIEASICIYIYLARTPEIGQGLGRILSCGARKPEQISICSFNKIIRLACLYWTKLIEILLRFVKLVVSYILTILSKLLFSKHKWYR